MGIWSGRSQAWPETGSWREMVMALECACLVWQRNWQNEHEAWKKVFKLFENQDPAPSKAPVCDFFFFFFGWCYSYGPQQGPDRQQKKRGERAQAEEKAKGSCSRRPRTKERKPGKRKKPKIVVLRLILCSDSDLLWQWKLSDVLLLPKNAPIENNVRT